MINNVIYKVVYVVALYLSVISGMYVSRGHIDNGPVCWTNQFLKMELLENKTRDMNMLYTTFKVIFENNNIIIYYKA